MCKKRKLKSISAPDGRIAFRSERPEPPPFIRNIQTTDERRVYSFQPEKKYKFQIVVEFPISNYNELRIQVAGESISPEELKKALKFVESNELQFAEAFDVSMNFKPIVMDDKNFLELPD